MRTPQTGEATPRRLVLPKREHPLGALFFGQEGEPLPFTPSRFYFVKGIPRRALRGGHAHNETHEAIFCVEGACTLMLFDRDGGEVRFRLEDPASGAYVPPGWWVELADYTEGAMTLVVASFPFAESDYIRQPEDFFHESPYPDPVSRPRP
jgi:oxalate decarboxylase/phosphoglucose isomerase-like protein (cupin superfamily)